MKVTEHSKNISNIEKYKGPSHSLTDRELAYSRLKKECKFKHEMTDTERLDYIRRRWEHFRSRFEDGTCVWSVGSIDYDDIDFLLSGRI